MNTQLGITGTRDGFTIAQLETFKSLLKQLTIENAFTHFHQGQCVGVDVEAGQYIADNTSMLVVSHPPKKEIHLGTCTVHVSHQPDHYFNRNRHIVDASDIMIVVPNSMQHRNYGGTWYTHDYALSKSKKVYVIYPDGSLENKG